MPSSSHYQISKIMNLVVKLNPSSILDVGVGFGKYGVLCREYLELGDGREEYDKFLRRIDGIEAFKNYITPLHRFIYDHIYIGDVLDLIDKLKFNYDLVLIIDVLEHLSKHKGRILINKLLEKHGSVLISTPRYIGIQKDVFNNPYEEHKAQWSRQELSRLGESIFLRDDVSFILYVGRRDDIKKLRRQLLVENTKMFLASIPFVASSYHTIKRYF
ncbi:hypothetical protein COT48_00175 [Candidatus Woesearchaeota archaeon CG08_land_8_20_14_0_20_47_9]|nr:MAG: hypothetical protein AUJ69_03055 [Candidatus Woesearchaeota archaeon CG1_02_47_18]PIO04482.1 MAG: hypothetical protein COT48_00175 [Candidatus Woesearchaeota archaeon CG08_land_8_20_14_0_20_47_9]